MTNYKIKISEKIKIKDKIIPTIKKVDEFLDKLVQYFLILAHKWFKLMNWLIVSAIILYAYKKYKLYGFNIIFYISFSLILFYLILSIKKKLGFLNKYCEKNPMIDLVISLFFIILSAIISVLLLYIISGLSLS